MHLRTSMSSYYEKFADGSVRCIDDEIPFDIPKGWEWCRIKNICMMQAGKNISSSEIFQDKSDLHPYRCVGGNGLRGYVSTFNTSGHYAIVGRQGALCGCLNIEKGDFYATEHAVIVDSYNILSPIFLYYFLTALNLNQYATATAQPGLAVSNVVEVLFPLPTLLDQNRIIEKLNSVLPLVEEYDEAEVQLGRLNQNLNVKIKYSILQEAVQGRLVPQIESEGTAEELLEEIRAEKKRLVKEGKLKKSTITNESHIFRGEDNKYYEQIGSEILDITNEIPFQIPSNWEWCRLSNVIQLVSGRDLEPTEYNDSQIGIPYITGASNFSNEKLQINRWTKNPVTISVAGDLLITCKGTIGQMAFNSVGEIHIARQIMAIRGRIISLQYVKCFLETMINTLQKQAKSMIPGISRENLLRALFPLPPIIEQNRIVKRLEEISKVI